MGIPARPHWQPQGPDSRCTLGGVQLGWENCTPTSFAMAIEKASLNRMRPTGCDIRSATADRSGGTTLLQCRTVAENEYGIHVEVHSGGNVTTMVNVARHLRAGASCVLQGDAGVTVGTKYRSVNGSVNHAIYINEVRGGTIDVPSEALVYDPAADGRRAGIAQGPQWWPWSLVLKFAAALRPNGPGTPVLGSGKAYVAFFPDTEPHVHLWTGAVRTKPFPDRQKTALPPGESGRLNIRRGPSKRYAVVDTIAPGQLWIAYQYKPNGGLDNGTTGWYGDHNGSRWVHESGLINEGGTS